MRALVQRVARASVEVEGRSVASIGHGLLVLVGVAGGDTEEEAGWVAARCAHLRVFEDESGRMNRSLLEVDGEALVVSQFTLYGDCRKGRRPAFTAAAPAERGEILYRVFVQALREEGVRAAEGVFGARMQVHLLNDGPVTLLVEKERT
jgi:D-tyrosyl-tRNA(Tyr) deacylase